MNYVILVLTFVIGGMVSIHSIKNKDLQLIGKVTAETSEMEAVWYPE